jgi:hypothetical protein
MSAGEFGLWQAWMEAEEAGAGSDRDRWALMLASLHNGPLIRRDKKLWNGRDFAPPIWAQKRESPKPTKAQADAQIREFAAKLGKSIRKR